MTVIGSIYLDLPYINTKHYNDRSSLDYPNIHNGLYINGSFLYQYLAVYIYGLFLCQYLLVYILIFSLLRSICIDLLGCTTLGSIYIDLLGYLCCAVYTWIFPVSILGSIYMVLTFVYTR